MSPSVGTGGWRRVVSALLLLLAVFCRNGCFGILFTKRNLGMLSVGRGAGVLSPTQLGLLLLLLLSCMCDAGFLSEDRNFALIPSDSSYMNTDDVYVWIHGKLFVERGSAIRLKCTIKLRDAGCRNVTSRQITFRRNNIDVLPSMVTTLDKDSALMVLQNADFNETEHFYCTDTCHNTSGAFSVHVGVGPLEPELEGCVIEGWSKLNCTWGPSQWKQHDYSHVGQKKSDLIWQPLDQQSNSTPRVCSDELNTHSNISESCTQSLSDGDLDMVINVTLLVGNVFGTIRSEPTLIDFRTIVKPTVIEISSITWSPTNATHLKLMWKSPVPQSYLATVPDVALKYQLTGTYRYEADPNKTPVYIEALAVNQTEVYLPRKAYSEYSVTISSCIIPEGVTSDSAVYEFEVPPQVPASNPWLYRSVYNPTEHEEEGPRTVSIYWQPLPFTDNNGPGLKYQVKAEPSDIEHETVSEVTSKTFCTLTLESQVSYKITVQAFNEDGAANSLIDVLTIPKSTQMITPVKESSFVVEANDRTVYFYWQPLAYAEKYVIYKCSDSNHELICKETIESQDVPGNESEFVWNMTEDDDRSLYGISAVSGTGEHSYMTMQECIYSRSHDPDPVSDVMLSTNSLPYGSVKVTWTLPQCNRINTAGYPLFILVQYCSITSNTCEVSSTRGNMTGIILDDLEEGSTYNFTVITETATGRTKSLVIDSTQEMPTNWLTSVGIIIALIIGAIVCLVVIIFFLSRCKKLYLKYTRGLHITLPERTREHLTSTSSETPFLAKSCHGSLPTTPLDNEQPYPFKNNEASQPMMSPYTTINYPRHDDNDDDVFEEAHPLDTYNKIKHVEAGDSGHVGSGLGSIGKVPYSTVTPNGDRYVRGRDINSNTHNDSGMHAKYNHYDPYTPVNLCASTHPLVSAQSSNSGHSFLTQNTDKSREIPPYLDADNLLPRETHVRGTSQQTPAVSGGYVTHDNPVVITPSSSNLTSLASDPLTTDPRETPNNTTHASLVPAPNGYVRVPSEPNCRDDNIKLCGADAVTTDTTQSANQLSPLNTTNNSVLVQTGNGYVQPPVFDDSINGAVKFQVPDVVPVQTDHTTYVSNPDKAPTGEDSAVCPKPDVSSLGTKTDYPVKGYVSQGDFPVTCKSGYVQHPFNNGYIQNV